MYVPIEIGRFVVDFCLYTVFRWCWCIDNAKSVTKTIKVWHHSVLAKWLYITAGIIFCCCCRCVCAFLYTLLLYNTHTHTHTRTHSHIWSVFMYTEYSMCVHTTSWKKALSIESIKKEYKEEEEAEVSFVASFFVPSLLLLFSLFSFKFLEKNLKWFVLNLEGFGRIRNIAIFFYKNYKFCKSFNRTRVYSLLSRK